MATRATREAQEPVIEYSVTREKIHFNIRFMNSDQFFSMQKLLWLRGMKSDIHQRLTCVDGKKYHHFIEYRKKKTAQNFCKILEHYSKGTMPGFPAHISPPLTMFRPMRNK